MIQGTVLMVVVSLSIGCSRTSPQGRIHSDEQEVTVSTLKVLAIGNSFSSDAVDYNLYDLFKSAGLSVLIGNLNATGSSLADHWNRAEGKKAEYTYIKIVDGKRTITEKQVLDDILSDEAWDIVTIQQASAQSADKASYLPYAQNLKQFVLSKTHAEVVFHQTWSYAGSAFENEPDNSQELMYQRIVAAVEETAKTCSISRIIPCGTSVQNARSSYLGDHLNRDYLHLEMNYGRYLAACTWFEALSGKSVVGNAYFPDSITKELATLCQTAAHLACLKRDAVTPMTDFQNKPE